MLLHGLFWGFFPWHEATSKCREYNVILLYGLMDAGVVFTWSVLGLFGVFLPCFDSFISKHLDGILEPGFMHTVNLCVHINLSTNTRFKIKYIWFCPCSLYNACRFYSVKTNYLERIGNKRIWSWKNCICTRMNVLYVLVISWRVPIKIESFKSLALLLNLS